MELIVRRLEPGEENLALKAVRELIPEEERDGCEPSILHLQRFLSPDSNTLILATVDSTPVGFLTAYRMPQLSWVASMMYLFEIEVAASFRRQGLARRMINLLKQLCQQSDVEFIEVRTENENLAAKRLYESTGGTCTYPYSCEYVYMI